MVRGVAQLAFGYPSAVVEIAHRVVNYRPENHRPGCNLNARANRRKRKLEQRLRRGEAVAVLGGELAGPRHETGLAAGISDDVLRRATGPRREADAHDRADVGVGGRREHALVEALLGLQRLGEQHPVDHVLQRWLRGAGLERLAQPGPQAGSACRRRTRRSQRP